MITDRGPKAEQLSTRRRKEWLTKINRKNWVPTSCAYVCSIHFVGGIAADLLDDTNPAWVPTIMMGYTTKEGDLGRYNRCKRRREQQDNCSVKCTPSSFSNSQDEDWRTLSHQLNPLTAETTSEHVSRSVYETPGPSVNEQPIANYSTTETVSEDVSMDERASQIVDEVHFPTVTEVDTVEQQIELDNIVDSDRESEIKSLQLDNQSLRDEVTELKSRHAPVFTMELFENNQDVLKFYTALPNWIIFKAVFDLVSPSLPTSPNSKLSTFQMIIMFLMKLRLNLFDEDIGYRFSAHRTTVSRNFHKVLDVMDVKLSHLIKWPDREILRETLPTSFRRFFKKCAIIIDCTEVFVERPSDLLARAQMWSNYKHHSTIKFLIGITPQGIISYLSRYAGGRISDKQIVEQSGLLQHLLPGDVIIADRGFTCDEYAHMALAEIKIPPFTKGKKQLEKLQVDWSRELSIVRIHVERVIGVLKQKYTILQSTLPINFIANRDQEAATIDKLVRVCCALSPSVVPQE